MKKQTKPNFYDYEKYEEAVKKIRKENEAHLKGFEQWLTDKGLAKKTIRNHVNNVDFYINEFLVRYEANNAAKGCSERASEFLGDWFIRKTTWSSCAEIRANAASFKKFYTYMLEKGEIEKDAYDDFIIILKEEISEWLEKMKEYESMEIDS